jgi:hypothetical protein
MVDTGRGAAANFHCRFHAEGAWRIEVAVAAPEPCRSRTPKRLIDVRFTVRAGCATTAQRSITSTIAQRNVG